MKDQSFFLLVAISVLLLPAACTLSPDPGPVVPVGITVVPRESGRHIGAQATYAIEAPLEVVRREVLDFDSQAYRPIVTEARTLSAGPEGGECYFLFRRTLGVAPEAVCTFTVAEEGETVLVRYEMTNSSLALMGLSGGFDLTPLGEGRTLVRQEFLLSALMVSRASLVEDLRTDAASIREHIEEVWRVESGVPDQSGISPRRS